MSLTLGEAGCLPISERTKTGLFIHLPVGLFGICLTWRYAEETTQTRDRKLDIFGQAVAIFALVDLAAATIEGGALGWTYSWVLAGFTLFALAAAAFVFIEARTKNPRVRQEV